MARSGVNASNIIQAAESIQADGRTPTVDRVRAYLGTGSKSTIAPVLKQWRTANISSNVDHGLPVDLMDVVKSLNARVHQHAEGKIEQIQSECNSVTDMLRQQLSDASTQITQLSEDNATVRKRLQDSQIENKTITQSHQVLLSRHDKTAYELESAHTRIAELKTENAEMKRECKDIRAHFEHYQERTAQDRQHERDQFQSTQFRDQAHITLLTEQLQELTAQLANSVTKQTQLEKKTSVMKDDNQSLANRLAEKSKQCSTLQKEIIAKQQDNSVLKQEMTIVRRQIDALTSQSVEADKTLGLLTQSYEGISAELKLLKINHHNLQNKYQLALEEKALLQGQYKQLAMSLSYSIQSPT
jgi:chromosome segregation ATPase